VTPGGLRLAGNNLTFAGPPPRIIHPLRELNRVNLDPDLLAPSRKSNFFKRGDDRVG
jgi:hypothetical protein